jgi:fused signal recognition particle receptor
MFEAFDKLKESLTRTKASIFGKIADLVLNRKIDDELLDEIEETLIKSDLGVKTSTLLITRLKEKAKASKMTEAAELIPLLKNEIADVLSKHDPGQSNSKTAGAEVWIIVGVNGTGKTTTVGKLATLFSNRKKKVMIAACDTFRAAAVDQIAIWASRSRVEIIKAQEGSDPASVAFDAATAAKARGIDLLLIDTAGRLHTKTNLMEELKKIRRVVAKALPESKILCKLVIDGSTGQNAISQARIFKDAVGCDGVIITKLDGTAKGGVVIAISEELGIPIDYIGIGEGIEDLRPFDSKQFAEALFS